MNLDVDFLINDQHALADAIVAGLAEYTDAFLAVAYGTYPAFALLERTSALSRFLSAGHRLRVLFDADRHFTDPRLITELATFPGDVECRLFAPRARQGPNKSVQSALHAKVYYFESPDDALAIVGSANFSSGGLDRNFEAAVQVRGPADAPVFVAIREFLTDIWNSPYQIGVLENSDFMQAYEAAYASARKHDAARPIPSEAPIYQSAKDVEQLRDAFAAGTDRLHDEVAAYILGLISGGWQAGDLRRRVVTIQMRRGTLNRGSDREGQVYFEGVSEHGFDQSDCVARDVERIVTRLQRSFDLMSSGDAVESEKRSALNYRIQMRFARNSHIWQPVRDELRIARTVRQYLWPIHLDTAHSHVRRSFLQGYLDLRTRISATDALPPPQTLMRVAVSVGGVAPSGFAEKLRQLIAIEFNCDPKQINLLSGAARGRESLLRIDARLIPKSFLESHWQRIVVENFREFNDRAAGSKQ